MSVRKALRNVFERLLRRSARCWSEAELRRPALVVAPHPDDETLGCGGAIVSKKRAGADVKIVFMTDGARSHANLIDEERMRSIRREEALSAARVLGVPGTDVFFLDHTDGELRASRAAAVEQLKEILVASGAEQVFAPYRRDTTDDHVVTHAVVEAAVRAGGRRVTVYEYPIWFWRRWPWSTSRGRGVRGLLRNTKDLALWAWATAFRFRDGMTVTDALAAKRQALGEHKSQTTQLVSDPTWQTLTDVAEGEFLKCFFQGVEPFAACHPKIANS